MVTKEYAFISQKGYISKNTFRKNFMFNINLTMKKSSIAFLGCNIIK